MSQRIRIALAFFAIAAAFAIAGAIDLAEEKRLAADQPSITWSMRLGPPDPDIDGLDAVRYAALPLAPDSHPCR